jgi:hypothetical protein
MKLTWHKCLMWYCVRPWGQLARGQGNVRWMVRDLDQWCLVMLWEITCEDKGIQWPESENCPQEHQLLHWNSTNISQWCLSMLKKRTSSGQNVKTVSGSTNSLIETHSMVLSPSWEATSCAATQQLPCISWNPKVHYCVHMGPLTMPILSQASPVHTTPCYIHVNIIHPPAFWSFSPNCATCPSHLTPLN